MIKSQNKSFYSVFKDCLGIFVKFFSNVPDLGLTRSVTFRFSKTTALYTLYKYGFGFFVSMLPIRIEDPVPFLTSGSGMAKNPDPESGILNKHPGSYFQELNKNYLG
jgi:hypothetical protein